MNFKFGYSNIDGRGGGRQRSCSVTLNGSCATSQAASPRNTGERNSNEVFFTAFAKVNNSDTSERKKQRCISVPVLMPESELLRKQDLESFKLSMDSSSLSSLEDLPSTDLCSTEL